MTTTTVTAVALTAVIGYVGAEVAEESLLERLLWPQRFNHDMTFYNVVQRSLLLTSGGPLHHAALKTLDTLRAKGMYAGPCRGHMLGTGFYFNHEIMHFQRCSQARMLIPEKSRNAFWIRVLHDVNADQHISFKIPRKDVESNRLSDIYRSLQPVYHLKLGLIPNSNEPSPDVICVQEDTTSVAVISNVFFSELVSVIASMVAGLKLGDLLFFFYMLVPLFLKVLLVVFAVSRGGLMSQQELQKVAEKENTDMSNAEAFEVADPIHKFMVLEGPQPVVVQFFRHYGHPIRDRNSLWVGDRFREIVCMTIICCLFLYFPIGLIISQWSDEKAQYLWLGYQMYAITAMHVLRFLGWQDLGRTEKRIARLLSNGKTVWLKTEAGCAVSASLSLHRVNKSADGKAKVQEIIDVCKDRLAGGEESREESRPQESIESQIQRPPENSMEGLNG
ncbi:hypothetical protein B0J14DRAFT_14442 [Halenospora varia]|nr:hypothetical protein B0J14DRAFT_14442 [Halenospora varia]